MTKYLVCISYQGESGPSSLVFALSGRDPADVVKKTGRMLEHEQWLRDHGIGHDHPLRHVGHGIQVLPMAEIISESEDTHRRQMLSERI